MNVEENLKNKRRSLKCEVRRNDEHPTAKGMETHGALSQLTITRIQRHVLHAVHRVAKFNREFNDTRSEKGNHE
jgi:hypothetical protein